MTIDTNLFIYFLESKLNNKTEDLSMTSFSSYDKKEQTISL